MRHGRSWLFVVLLLAWCCGSRDAGGEPKTLWVVMAADCCFSDNLAEFDWHLFEALACVQRNAPVRTIDA